MNKTFGLIWKSKITLPIVIAAFAATSFLAISHYKIGQTASVNAASCYLQPEIDDLINQRATLEANLQTVNDSLSQISTDRITNNDNIKQAQGTIDSLKSTLASDYVLSQKKALVDSSYAELADRKAIDDLLAQYVQKKADASSQLQAINTSSYALLPKISAQRLAKSTLESQIADLATGYNTLALLTNQIADMKNIESAKLIVTNAKSGAPYNTALQNYNTLVKQYTSKYTKYSTLSSADLTSVYNSQKKTYDTANSALIKSTAAYNALYNNDTRTSAVLATLYTDTAKKATQEAAALTKMNNQLQQTYADADTLTTKATALANAYKIKYKYNTSVPETTVVQKRYNDASSTYKDLLKKNSDIQDQINIAQADLDSYNAKATDLDANETNTNQQITGLTNKINDLNTAISNDQNNICPATETSCSDGIDNDRDGVQDCDDSDCVNDLACQTHAAEICNNGADDDGNGQTDCADSACASDSTCQTHEICNNGADDDGNGQTDCADSACASDSSCNIVVTMENCSDGIDNDSDGLVDCGDSDCVNDPVCTTIKVDDTKTDDKSKTENDCKDGVDNDGNGLTDCQDNACSGTDACICRIKDSAGNDMGSCDDFGVSSQAELDEKVAAAAGGDSGSLVKSPSQCPAGTEAVAIGQTKGLDGAVVNFYKCVKNSDNTEKSICGNGKIDAGEECEEGESVSNGSCVSCSISCDAGFSRTKTFWSAINPFGTDKYKCSAYTTNETGACGNSYGDCINGDLDETKTNGQSASDRSKYWFCGSTKCSN
ncbi:MAG: hypothetical protein V4469_05420 [Patescibacteria group bacterium]